ncbi:outer membrane beta-barrel protein [Methylobacterium sp. DB0501]|jgi:high affinity Mn2+ porin|nr:outer membrane beta-barrel protein [Methylobacterium sp. DB0501]
MRRCFSAPRRAPIATVFSVLAIVINAVSPGRAADRTAVEPRSSLLPAFVGWSGGYAGIEGSAGGSYGAYNFGPTTIGAGAVPAFKTGDATGRSDRGREATTAVGGVFGGWNWQQGSWIYGLEVSIDGANLKRPVASTVPGFGYADINPAFNLIRGKTDLYGMLRARFGYSFDRYLVYATFGLAGANARFLASYPNLASNGAAASQRDMSYLGFTLGAGAQFAIHPNFAVGIDYRYIDLGDSSRFGFGIVPGSTGGPVTTQANFTSHQMMARLMWFPEGLRLSPEPHEAALHDPDNGDTGRFSLHGQTTLVAQGVSGFRSPYLGPQSLVPHQAQQTTTATAFLGFKITEGTEFYYNPEFSQGFGLSRTLGVAGFVNGEAQKAGAPFPKLRSSRYFVRQTFGLGGETEDVLDGPNQVATQRDVERITVVAGKFAMGDFFDGNVYAHDPRVDFFNWALWASSAWDFPANLAGYTQGVVVEYNRKEFAVRAAYAQVPKEPSSNVLDPRILQKGGLNVELEVRYSVLDQAGRLRFGAFSNEGRSANYREAVTLTGLDPVAFPDANTAALANRKNRNKSGGYINLEQALSPTLGMFARISASDGRNESLSFADIDRSASGGFSLKGTTWGRSDDAVGIGAAINGISRSHREFFAKGGLGLVIGEGQLRYRPETILETYYSVSLTRDVALSLDYQFVANPGYNRDRGPAHFFSARLHTDF